MEIKGKIIVVLEERKGINERTGEEWRVKEYVMEQDGASSQEFAKHAFFVVRNKRIDDFNLAVGDHIIAYVDIDAREYSGRWYTRITAYKVERVSESYPQVPQSAPTAQAPAMPFPSTAEQTDLGF